MSCKSILLFTFAFVLATGEQLFEPCSKDDLQCLKTATDSFMTKTYPGNTKLGLLPMDPLTISSLEVPVDDKIGLGFYFTNVKVTGLKNLETTDFKMNTDKKTVLLKLKANIEVTGDIEIKATKSQKSFKGIYTASATVEETENYSYSFKTKDGKEYYELGAEVPSCEVYGIVTEDLSKELQNSLVEDSDGAHLRQEYLNRQAEYNKKTICKISDAAFKTVVNNLRILSSVLPKGVFFTDV